MRTTRRSQALRDRLDLRAVVLLTLVWVMLWGSFTWIDLLGGVVVAVLVCLAFPMPRLTLPITVRPLALLRLVRHFLVDLVVSSASVAWVVFTCRRSPGGTLFEVPLHSRDEFYVSTVAGMTTLVPGSVVLDVERTTGTLLVHGFRVHTAREQEEFRQRVWHQEQLLLQALHPHAGREEGA